MKESMKISIIIPSYNHSAFVRKTINSVLNQSFDNFEIIIIDDCSTDNSVEIIDSFGNNRIKKYFSNNNSGTVETLNLGLSKASGKYIAILGSDDVWYREKLQKQVDILENNPEIGACFSWADIIDENDKPYEKCGSISLDVFSEKNKTQGEWIRRFFETGNHLCHSSSLVRRNVYNELGKYKLGYRQLHDFEYWIRLINNYKIFVIEEPLVGYRRAEINNVSVSGVTDENTLRIFNETYNIWFNYFLSGMNDKIFIEAFKDKFINKKALLPEEIACEKFFVLRDLNVGGIFNKQLAINFLIDKINEENIMNCLKNKYNFTLEDFYKETGTEFLFYPKKFHKNVKISSEEVEKWRLKYFELSAQCENTVNEIYSSASWRITKPLRRLSEKIRNYINIDSN